jgi:ribosome-associated translation inhibitor RaiA
MNVQISHKNWDLPEADRDILERRIARINKKLPHMSPDLLHLVVRIDKHATHNEYICAARLSILNQILAVRGRYERGAHSAISQTFDDVERQLDKFMAGLKQRA